MTQVPYLFHIVKESLNDTNWLVKGGISRESLRVVARSKKRHVLSTAVRIRCQDWDQFRTEHAHNISEGGIFVETSNPLKPGTLFSLEFNVATETISATAQVIWTKEFSPEEKRPSGMGARFVEMDEASKATLLKWLVASGD